MTFTDPSDLIHANGYCSLVWWRLINEGIAGPYAALGFGLLVQASVSGDPLARSVLDDYYARLVAARLTGEAKAASWPAFDDDE
jgi:hypothetical protein